MSCNIKLVSTSFLKRLAEKAQCQHLFRPLFCAVWSLMWCCSHKHAMWQEEQSLNSCRHATDNAELHGQRGEVLAGRPWSTATTWQDGFTRILTVEHRYLQPADQRWPAELSAFSIYFSALSQCCNSPASLLLQFAHPRTQQLEFEVCVYLCKNPKQRQREPLIESDVENNHHVSSN